jgi:hypothetical protein
MTVRLRFLGSALVAGALIAAIALPTTANAADPTTPVRGSTAKQGAREMARSTIEYWSPARMKAARTVRMPAPSTRTPRLGAALRPDAEPGHLDGSSRGGGAPTAALTPADAYTYPFPFTRYAVEAALYETYPYRTVGRIFFRQNGVDYACSGASVAGSPRQVVYTAGHCLSDGAGVFSRKVVFVPAYRDGKAPYGVFPALNLWVTTGWHEDSDFTYDLGAFNVGRNAAGQLLRNRVGYLGFAWNQSPEQHWNVLGYPSSSPFTGRTMQVCQASYAADDLAVEGSGPWPTGIGCDMTRGSSGGPWVVGWKRSNWLNGVNSYKYDSQPLATYGPYFDDAAVGILCAAATGNAAATSC